MIRSPRPAIARPIRRRGRTASRDGLAALEVVLTLGAMVPIAVVLLRLLREGLRLYLTHIANVVGNPLF